jgi:Fe-S oxidoreductase
VDSLIVSDAHRYARIILMATLLIVGFGFAIRTVYWLLRYVGWGEGNIEVSRIPERIKGFLTYVIGQRKVIAEPGGLLHLFIFWGFLILQLETIEYMARGFVPSFHFSLLVGMRGCDVLLFLQDIFGGLVFVAISLAAIRRFVVKPKHVVASTDSAVILGLIGALMLTKFMANGAEITYLLPENFAALEANARSEAIARLGHTPIWTPIAFAASGLMSTLELSRQSVFWLYHVNYWVHIGIVVAFANYIPFGKHLHLIGAMPNIFFRKLDNRGALSPIDMEDMSKERFGAGEVEDLSWKELLDSYACTECGRCEHYCPAYNTGKPLNPMEIIHKIKDVAQEKGERVLRNGEDPDDVHMTGVEDEYPGITGNIITKEELSACTTCGACVENCPVFIEHVDSIVDMRRYMSLTEAEYSPEVSRTFRNMEQNANPWGISSSYRADWADEMDIPLMSELTESPDYLFWVGCAGSFDDRQKEVTRAFAKIMKAADISFAILGPEEGCTGDPARRIGNEYLYWMLAQQNVETLNSYDVTKIVTTCPHCFHTIGNEYPQLGGDYEVVHHTELINSLLEDGLLELESKGPRDITYHDSCYIGRWNDSYEDPRDVLDSVPDVQRQEMDLNREQSFCCGAGGGRMWMEEDTGKRVNIERTDQALDTDPDEIAVNCPFCLTMFDDGLKSRDAGDIPLKDLAEIIAESLEEEKKTEDSKEAAAE